MRELQQVCGDYTPILEYTQKNSIDFLGIRCYTSKVLKCSTPRLPAIEASTFQLMTEGSKP